MAFHCLPSAKNCPCKGRRVGGAESKVRLGRQFLEFGLGPSISICPLCIAGPNKNRTTGCCLISLVATNLEEGWDSEINLLTTQIKYGHDSTGLSYFLQHYYCWILIWSRTCSQSTWTCMRWNGRTQYQSFALVPWL